MKYNNFPFVFQFVLLWTSASVFCINVESTLADLADVAGVIEDVVDFVSNCEFSCPPGTVGHQNPNYKPSSDGCGSYGIEVRYELIPKLTDCCNKHDICYDTCGSVKTTCDKEMKQCVEDLCSKIPVSSKSQEDANFNLHNVCESMAKLMGSSTTLFGCPAFKKAQYDACQCLPASTTGKSSEHLRTDM